MNPLILTLQLDASTQSFFDDLRRRHFPADRNYLGAHLTLFHALPHARLDDVRACLQQERAGSAPLPLKVTHLRPLGRGVAYALDGVALLQLRARIAQAFADELTPQDAQGFRPHVTVQNKVGKREADITLEALSRDFVPFDCSGVALLLWQYAGGPWTPLQRFEFDS